MCKCVLPPGDNPIAINKYIISYHQFPVVSLDFSVTYSFEPYCGPGVDSARGENEYQEHFLGVKAASA